MKARKLQVCDKRVDRILSGLKRRAVDDQRLRVGALQFDCGLHQAFDRIRDIVRLIEHVSGRMGHHLASPDIDKLIENQKQTERLHRPSIEIIVAIF